MQHEQLNDSEAALTPLVQQVVRATVGETLTSLGMDCSKPLELQKDMAFLRSWREGATGVQSKLGMVVLGTVVSGLLMLVGVGIKTWIR